MIWSDPYEDASGLGPVVTAALPVSSPPIMGVDGQTIPGRLVAVVGHDASISTLAGADHDEITARLARKNNACVTLELTDCQFQVIHCTI